jgi:hypothetical protein
VLPWPVASIKQKQKYSNLSICLCAGSIVDIGEAPEYKVSSQMFSKTETPLSVHAYCDQEEQFDEKTGVLKIP